VFALLTPEEVGCCHRNETLYEVLRQPTCMLAPRERLKPAQCPLAPSMRPKGGSEGDVRSNVTRFPYSKRGLFWLIAATPELGLLNQP